MEKFVNHCSSFEHAAVINRQPVKSLEDGCNAQVTLWRCLVANMRDHAIRPCW